MTTFNVTKDYYATLNLKPHSQTPSSTPFITGRPSLHNTASQLFAQLVTTPAITQQDIRRAYKQLSLTTHPDKPGGDTKRFQEIQEAHEVLSDEVRRREYDTLRARMSGARGGDGYGHANGQGWEEGQADGTRAAQTPNYGYGPWNEARRTYDTANAKYGHPRWFHGEQYHDHWTEAEKQAAWEEELKKQAKKEEAERRESKREAPKQSGEEIPKQQQRASFRQWWTEAEDQQAEAERQRGAKQKRSKPKTWTHSRSHGFAHAQKPSAKPRNRSAAKEGAHEMEPEPEPEQLPKPKRRKMNMNSYRYTDERTLTPDPPKAGPASNGVEGPSIVYRGTPDIPGAFDFTVFPLSQYYEPGESVRETLFLRNLRQSVAEARVKVQECQHPLSCAREEYYRNNALYLTTVEGTRVQEVLKREEQRERWWRGETNRREAWLSRHEAMARIRRVEEKGRRARYREEVERLRVMREQSKEDVKISVERGSVNVVEIEDSGDELA